MIEPFVQNPNVMAVVRVEAGQVVANSHDVAAFFHKGHNEVLKKFRALDCSDEFRLGNFTQTVVTRPNPSGGEPIESPAFDMTRDGFVFIAFGFTGKRAAKFKEDYIAAFNDMEARLGRRTQVAAQPTGQLAMALETNDSLAGIERQMHAIHTGLGAKIDALAGAIIGSLIKHIGRPILDRLEENQRWNEMRFEAIHRRDKLLIQSLGAKQEAEDCVSIAVAQTMMGVPAAHRSSRLSRNLSANAIHWFVAHGFTARPDTSHASGPWVFQKSKVADWWQASGKAIFERAVPKPSADVLPFKSPERGPAA